jgi:lipopolysaccharide export system permease protein
MPEDEHVDGTLLGRLLGQGKMGQHELFLGSREAAERGGKRTECKASPDRGWGGAGFAGGRFALMRLPVLDRYLLRELTLAMGAVTLVLLLITVGGLFTDTLSKIARGKVAGSLLLTLVGLRAVEALALLLPLAAFLAVLATVGRLYRDSEMAVLQAAGVGPLRLLRPLLGFAMSTAAALALLSFELTPAASRTAKRLIEEANRSLLVAGLDAGRFVELAELPGVIYVAELARDGSEFRRLFVFAERAGRLDVVTAERGWLRVEDGARVLVLERGHRVEGDPDRLSFRTVRFARNEVLLPELAPERRDPRALADWRELLQSAHPADRAELHWRLSAPVAVLTLTLLALPLARAPPRQGRHGRFLVGVLVYLVYANGLAIGRQLIGEGALSAGWGLWPLHAAVALLALWLLRRGEMVRAGRLAG